jgi:hypothetical protein
MYPSGQTIAFASPLAAHGMWLLPSFTLTSSGTPCLQFDQAMYSQTITTSAGAVTLSEDPGQTTATVACPGGASVSGSVKDLSACQETAPGGSQGCSCSSMPDDAGIYQGRFTLSFYGTTGPNGVTQVFDCGTP